MTLRRPAVAGTFYPAGKAELGEAIDASYMHRLGPGRLPPLVTPGPAPDLKACAAPTRVTPTLGR